MNPLTALMDAVLGRRRKLEELHQARAELVAEYERLVADDEDAGAAKVWAKVERLDADIRAAEAALRQTQAREAANQRAAEATEQRRREEARDLAEALPMRLAVELERDVLALAEKWRAFEDAVAAHRVKAVAAGTPSMLPGGMSPGKVWGVIWFRFNSAVQSPDRSPWTVPNNGSKSRTIETIVDRQQRYRKERAAAPVSQQAKEA